MASMGCIASPRRPDVHVRTGLLPLYFFTPPPYTPLYPAFSLSSLLYHGLYSLESPYWAAKSQEPDCFHVLGFIAGFLPR